MRHRINKKRLNRDMDHRKALLRNLSTELIKHENIETTLVKAKYFRPYVEKLITKAKEAAESKDKIRIFNILKDLRTHITSESELKKLCHDIGHRFIGVNGGYTKITKTRYRDGDKALMARIELSKKAKKEETKKSNSKNKKDTKKEAMTNENN